MSRGGAIAIGLALALSGCFESHFALADGEVPMVAPSAITSPCATPTSGTSRDCGWRVDSVRTCTPGTRLEVGCSASCGLGACTGDAMIRLCTGARSCTSSASFAQNDDACAGLCPRVETTCPGDGRYTILTAPFSSGTYTCSIAVR